MPVGYVQAISLADFDRYDHGLDWHETTCLFIVDGPYQSYGEWASITGNEQRRQRAHDDGYHLWFVMDDAKAHQQPGFPEALAQYAEYVVLKALQADAEAAST